MHIQAARALLRLCSSLLTPSSGKSCRCSRPETKTEATNIRSESDYFGINSIKFLSRSFIINPNTHSVISEYCLVILLAIC
jgi:hypothetical protein